MTGVALNKTTLALAVAAKETLTVTVEPTDATDIDKFGTIKQQTFDELMEYEKKHMIDGTLNAESVRDECKIIDRTFDKLLGDGAAKKMFSDTDIHERVAAFNKLVNLRESQVESYNKLVQSMAGD